MIIDFHTHVFPDAVAANAIYKLESNSNIKAYTDGTESSLYTSMCVKSDLPYSSNGMCVDLSIVLPVVTNPLKTEHVNDFALGINERSKEKFTQFKKRVINLSSNICTSTKTTISPTVISFAGIHPDTPDIHSVIQKIKQNGFKGIKLHPDYQNTFINDPRYKQIISEAEENNLVTVIHAGIDIGLPEPVHCTPEKALEMLNDVKPQRCVLAHMGGWKQWDKVEKYLVGKKVYFDTAFTDKYLLNEQYERIIKQHGANQILFGTDSPWSSPYETAKKINELNISTEEKQQIFYLNALELLFS